METNTQSASSLHVVLKHITQPLPAARVALHSMQARMLACTLPPL